MSSVSVPVMDDMLAEGVNEMFYLLLTASPVLGPTITAGARNRAMEVIGNTTGKHMNNLNSVLQILCSHF